MSFYQNISGIRHWLIISFGVPIYISLCTILLSGCSFFISSATVGMTKNLSWFWLIRHYPPSRLASFTFLTPFFGVFAGGLLLNEPMTSSLLLALVLVGVGIYLVNRPNAE